MGLGGLLAGLAFVIKIPVLGLALHGLFRASARWITAFALPYAVAVLVSLMAFGPALVRDYAGGLLDAYSGVAIPVQNGKLYRARFRGFDATAANATCSRLKTMQIDCFVTKTE